MLFLIRCSFLAKQVKILFYNISKQYLSPVLAEVLDSLEGRDELERDEALLVALDVLQQELVLGDVGVGEVELDLLNNLLAHVVARDLQRSFGFLLLLLIQRRLLGNADTADVGRLATGHAREVRDAGILRNLPVVVAGLVELVVVVMTAAVVVVVVLVEGLVGVNGVGVIHGVEILVGEVHGVGVESRELRVKSHCRSIKSVEPRDRKKLFKNGKSVGEYFILLKITYLKLTFSLSLVN